MSTESQILFNISIIIQIILFIAFIILVFVLTGAVKKLMLKVDSLNDEFTNFKVKVDPLIEDSKQLVRRLNTISEKIEGNIDSVRETVDKIRGVIDEVIDFKKRIQEKIEPPLKDTITFYTSVVKGIKVFFEKLREGKKSKKEEIPILPDTSSGLNEKFQSDFDDINKELNEVRKKLEEMKKV